MSAVTPGSSGARMLIAENSSQLMSSNTETGTRLGVCLMSLIRRSWRASSSGTKVDNVFSVPSTSVELSSRVTSRRKFGRLEARIAPLRSTIRPRGGGTRRKLNWFEAESFS